MAVHASDRQRTARLRRAAFVRWLRWQAARVDATVEVDVALDALLGRRIRVAVDPGTRNRLVLGPEARIRDDVRLHLHGGEVLLGGWSDVRDQVLLNVGGTLDVADGVILSWRTTVHCDGHTRLDEFAGASDGVVLVDSTHYHSDPDVPFHHNLRRGEIHVGRHTWLGTRAVVLRNSTIGDWCTVGAAAVVSGSVPDGHVALGNPAQVRPRERPLPWVAGEHTR